MSEVKPEETLCGILTDFRKDCGYLKLALWTPFFMLVFLGAVIWSVVRYTCRKLFSWGIEEQKSNE